MVQIMVRWAVSKELQIFCAQGMFKHSHAWRRHGYSKHASADPLKWEPTPPAIDRWECKVVTTLELVLLIKRIHVQSRLTNSPLHHGFKA